MSWFCLLVLYSVQSKHLPTTVHSIGGVGRLWFWCYTHTHTQTDSSALYKGIISKWSEGYHKGHRFDSGRCEKLPFQELHLAMTLQQSSFITPSGFPFPVLKKFKNTLVTFLIYIWYIYIWNTFYWACPLLPCTYITGHVSARISTCDGGPLVVQFIMFYQDRENWEISDVRSPGQLTQPEL